MIHAYNDPIIFDVSIEFQKKNRQPKKLTQSSWAVKKTLQSSDWWSSGTTTNLCEKPFSISTPVIKRQA